MAQLSSAECMYFLFSKLVYTHFDFIIDTLIFIYRIRIPIHPLTYMLLKLLSIIFIHFAPNSEPIYTIHRSSVQTARSTNYCDIAVSVASAPVASDITNSSVCSPIIRSLAVLYVQLLYKRLMQHWGYWCLE